MATSYNIGAPYEIIGRVTSGTSVTCYIIKERNSGNIMPVRKGEVEQLALNKQVYNCTAQIYGNIVNLKGLNCRLNKLPRYDMNGDKIAEVQVKKKVVQEDLKIVGKVQRGRVITDYIVVSRNSTDKPMKLPRDIVLQLAQEGRFCNAKSQMNKHEIMLRGSNGFNLSHLRTYNV